MSGSMQPQPTPGTGNGRTASRRPLKAGGKRIRRTKAQLAAAAAKQPQSIAQPVAAAPLKISTVRLATMMEWFGEASDAERKRDLGALIAMYPGALPKAA
jgi:hypothetical protein